MMGEEDINFPKFTRAFDKGGKDHNVISIVDHGKITEGIFVEDIWKGDKPHNDYTFEGERIRVIMPAHGENYRVFFDKQPWIVLDKWAICQEVKG